LINIQNKISELNIKSKTKRLRAQSVCVKNKKAKRAQTNEKNVMQHCVGNCI